MTIAPAANFGHFCYMQLNTISQYHTDNKMMLRLAPVMVMGKHVLELY